MLGAAAGCANDRDEHTSVVTDDLGAVRMAIAVAPGLDIESVSYSIQIPEHQDALQGTLPVGADGMVRGKVDDVPAAEGVLVSLTASNAAGVTCSGEGNVTVKAGEISNLSIGLQCRVPAGSTTTTGSISISGTFNACPKLLAAAADPTSTETTSAISANAEDADGDTLSFKWSAGAGEFADATLANTTYTCEAVGEQMLSVTVDDGKGCTHSTTVTVKCTEPTTPPAPVCGDSKKEGTEECDDGNTTAGDGCSATCTVEMTPPAPVCGDNQKADSEECDDGNTDAGDGCSATCSVEEPPPEGTDIPCDVQAVLKAKCQNCHGQPPTAAPIPLVSLADLRADAAAPNAGTPIWQRVKVRIGPDPGPAGAMPPTYSANGALTDAEKATLNAWLEAGAPGATCAPPI